VTYVTTKKFVIISGNNREGGEMTKVHSGTSSLDYASECTAAEIILATPYITYET